MFHWRWFRIHNEPWMMAARSRDRPAQRCKKLRCVYEKNGGRSRESREFLVPRRNIGGSWARARKPARFGLLTRGAFVTIQAMTEAKYPDIRRTTKIVKVG
jgi:hypothetical protein